MNKQENKLVPELRFPEFRNEEEWEEKKIGDVFESFSGGTPNTTEKEYYNGKIPFIRSAEINKIETELFLSDLGLKNSSAKIVEKGDLLIALYGANSGDSAISKIKGAINQAVLCLKSEFSNVFTNNYLTYRKDWIISKFVQGGQGNLSGDIIKSLSIPFPRNSQEQQKIASCLSSLDDVITAHTDKLENLKLYKKGLLQNLFPQEGETVPKLRFKEFEKDGEWNKDNLDNLAKIINEKVGNRKFTLISIDAGVGLVSQKEKFGREIAGNSYSNYIVIKRDDFAFNKSSTKYFPEGQISILNNYEVGAVPNSIFTCFRFHTEIINPHYVKYLFENNIHGKWLKKFITIGARANGALNVNNKDLFSLEIPFPNNKKEQQKIASLLSSVDDLIKAETDKITQLKAHKKGLLQGLFPKID